MPKFECEGTIVRAVLAESERAAVEQFSKAFSATPTYVGSTPVLGMCDACGKAILDGDRNASDGEGGIICGTCANPDQPIT